MIEYLLKNNWLNVNTLSQNNLGHQGNYEQFQFIFFKNTMENWMFFSKIIKKDVSRHKANSFMQKVEIHTVVFNNFAIKLKILI
jgi:hypothetical protein